MMGAASVSAMKPRRTLRTAFAALAGAEVVVGAVGAFVLAGLVAPAFVVFTRFLVAAPAAGTSADGMVTPAVMAPRRRRASRRESAASAADGPDGPDGSGTTA